MDPMAEHKLLVPRTMVPDGGVVLATGYERMPAGEDFIDVTLGEIARNQTRLQATLDRIEVKVESKVGKDDFLTLQNHVTNIENAGTRQAQRALELVNEQIRRLEKAEGRLEVLERGDAGQDAVSKYRYWLLALAGFLATLTGLALSNYFSIHKP